MGKRTTAFRDCAQAHVHRFNRIGGIDDTSDFWRVIKARDHAPSDYAMTAKLSP